MAITKSISYSDGVGGLYWELAHLRLDRIRRIAAIELEGWVSEASYLSNDEPAKYESIELTGQDYTDVFDESNESIATMSLAIANKVISKPKFSGGTIS